MKISFNWLKKYIDLQEPIEKIGEILTATGLEVEGIQKISPIPGGLNGLLIGKVMSCVKHPNADKLKLTTVDVGDGVSLPIVCGAPNVEEGQTVLVAPVDTTLYPVNSKPFKIKKAKIRGEVSEGMICAEDEVGLGTSHEGIVVLPDDINPGLAARDYYNLEDDNIIEIGLTPNRADATSHIGVARDLKAVLNRKLNWPDVNRFKQTNNNLPIEISVEDYDACPRYSGLTISNLVIKESPEWLKTALSSIGLTPVNNVVDVTNFVLHEMGQPLHAFDIADIKGKKIIVKTLEKGTEFTTLDSVKRKLLARDLMICNSEEGMCIGGVLGGLSSGIKESTSSIFLESAYFSPDTIRRTSQYHQIKTDAAFRFERGTDPNLTVYALKRAALLITELTGGEITSKIIDCYPKTINDFKINMSYDHISRLIGKKLEQNEIKKTLVNLDIQITKESPLGFVAVVPPYRVDVQREADVIEEILRIHGFDNIDLPETVGSSYLADFPEKDFNLLQHKVAGYLVGNGFYEIMTNSLTKPLYSALANSIDVGCNVEVINKLSEDLGVLRQSLLFTGLESLAYNINRRQKDLKFFEFGKQYIKKDKGYSEEQHLGLWITGQVEPETWMNKDQESSYHQLSGIVSHVLKKMHISKVEFSDSDNDIFNYGLTYLQSGKKIVEIGLVSKHILDEVGINQKIFYADFNWDLLLSKTSDNIVVERMSRFPEVRRDLSLVIDKSVQFEDIVKVAMKTERKLIKDLDVFDVYEGDNINDDQKAYSIKFILEDKEKTLNDKQIDKTMNRLISAFENELNALIRQ